MIDAAIAEDLFFLWSIDLARAATLTPPCAQAVEFEERGWIAVSAVRFRRLSVAGIPVAFNVTMAGLLLLVRYRTWQGEHTVGNLFLKGFTDSRIAALGDSLLGLRTFRHSRAVKVSREAGPPPGAAAVALPGLGLTLEPKVLEPADQRRLETLFAENHSGLVRHGDRLLYSRLSKAHWRMDGRSFSATDGSLLDGLEARPEFAFDTSHSRGSWDLLHRVVTD